MEEKPLDEEIFESATEGVGYREFPITKNKRLLVLLTVSYITLYLLRAAMSGFFPQFMEVSPVQDRVIAVFNLLAVTYYYYFAMTYFRYYQLHNLKVILSITLIGEIIANLINVAGKLYIEVPQAIFTVANVCLTVVAIIWIVMILRVKNYTNYSGFKSLRHSAIASIVALTLSFITPFLMFSFLSAEDYFYLNLVFFPAIVPFVFIIVFILKLKPSDKMN